MGGKEWKNLGPKRWDTPVLEYGLEREVLCYNSAYLYEQGNLAGNKITRKEYHVGFAVTVVSEILSQRKLLSVVSI